MCNLKTLLNNPKSTNNIFAPRINDGELMRMCKRNIQRHNKIDKNIKRNCGIHILTEKKVPAHITSRVTIMVVKSGF
jgi:hypothetical protein